MQVDIDIDDIIEEIKKFYTIEDIFSDDDILFYIKNYFEPDQIFTDEELTSWAINNGFSKDKS